MRPVQYPYLMYVFMQVLFIIYVGIMHQWTNVFVSDFQEKSLRWTNVEMTSKCSRRFVRLVSNGAALWCVFQVRWTRGRPQWPTLATRHTRTHTPTLHICTAPVPHPQVCNRTAGCTRTPRVGDYLGVWRQQPTSRREPRLHSWCLSLLKCHGQIRPTTVVCVIR